MRRSGLSIAEAIAVFVCIVVLGSLIADRVLTQRSLARRTTCKDQLKLLGLAIHNYHSAYRQLPVGSGGTDVGSEDNPMIGNANRLSALVGLLPFYQQQMLWEKIAYPYVRSDGSDVPPMGPAPWVSVKEYPPWGERPEILVCPSDKEATKSIASSYLGNFGDGIVSIGAPIHRAMPPYVMDKASKRGVFIREKVLRFRDVLDGLSNTLLMSESKSDARVAKGLKGLATNPSLAKTIEGKKLWPQGRADTCWADGGLRSFAFQTILPPNSDSATSDVGELEGVMSASSQHGDGAHALFCDGSVQFVLESIDCGDLTAPSVASAQPGKKFTAPGSRSPYGVWGALGTRASRERVNRDTLVSLTDSPVEIDETMDDLLGELQEETWKLKDGKTIEGKLFTIDGRKRAVIITKEKKTRSIALSDFESRDAYRAVATALEREISRLDEFRRDANSALRLLESRKFDEFAEKCLSKRTSPEQVAEAKSILPLRRGEIIQMLDEIVFAISSGKIEAVWSEDGKSLSFPKIPKASPFIFEDGRWKFGDGRERM